MFGKKQKPNPYKSKKSDVPLKSQEFLDRENKKRRTLLARVLFDLLLLAFVGVAVYVLFFSQFLEITKVNVRGASEISRGDLEQVVNAQLSGKHLKVVPKNNFILFSNHRTENAIKNQFKKVATVAITKTFPDALDVSITERQSLLVWCTGDACFLIDENGLAYAPADFNSPEVTENHLVKLTDTGGKAVAIGDKILDSDFLKYVSQIRDALKTEASIEASAEYSTPAAVSQEVSVTSPGGMRIMFSLVYPLDTAVKNLKLFLAKQNFPQPLSDKLEYIDLRSENKIFYKLKNASENSDDQQAPLDDKEGKDDKKE